MSTIERELKFAIEPGAELPDLSSVVTVGEPVTHELVATYLDTPELSLLAEHVVLRRRTGGGDEGWHLKLPAEPETHGRTEIHEPLQASTSPCVVPAALRAQVADVVRLKPLLPIAELRTTRVERALTAPDGARAVLCDDTVTATRRGSEPETWRELEIEMVSGDAELLTHAATVLAGQGIRPADHVSKLARAVGDPDAMRAPALSERSRAGEVVLAYVATQVGVLQGREAGVRTDEPDAVHKSRVATRRLRSVLATYGRLFDGEVTGPLREELKWYAGMLGGPRDAEVMRDRLTELVGGLSPDEVDGPVVERLTAHLNERHAQTHRELVEAMDSPRYAALMESLVAFLLEPPVRDRAQRRARGVLNELVNRPVTKVERLREQAAEADSAEEQLELLHEVRKKAKAARYAAEALVEAFGPEALARAKEWEAVTEGLGELQDSVVARQVIAEIRDAAAAAGESVFTYGVLTGLEHDRGEAVRSTVDAIIDSARDVSTGAEE